MVQKNQQLLKADIIRMRNKLDETAGDMKHQRGPVNDAVQIVVPVFGDVLNLIEDVVDSMPQE